MKVLFVANRVPYPPFRGDKLKIWNLANRLSVSHELDIITIAESKEDLNYAQKLGDYFGEVTLVSLPKWKAFLNTIVGFIGIKPLQVAYFSSRKFQKKLNKTIQLGNYDAIHIQHLRMAQFFENKDTSKCILDLPDAFSLYWLRRSENAKTWWMRKFAKMEYRRLLRYEKKILPQFSLNLVCSQEDRQYLTQNTGANIDVLPNGVDTDTFYPRKGVPYEQGRILFTGNMDYAPNVDAVEYFCHSIFPAIRQKIPGVKLIIAGQRPVLSVLNLAQKDIEITGFVPDLSEEYAKAHVVVAPLRFGAGTQNKVLESMAMGIPVVCTKVGFKGLGIQSGEGAILAETQEDFINATIRLIIEPEYRAEVASLGGAAIRKNFSWEAISKKLEAAFNR